MDNLNDSETITRDRSDLIKAEERFMGNSEYHILCKAELYSGFIFPEMTQEMLDEYGYQMFESILNDIYPNESDTVNLKLMDYVAGRCKVVAAEYVKSVDDYTRFQEIQFMLMGASGVVFGIVAACASFYFAG